MFYSNRIFNRNIEYKRLHTPFYVSMKACMLQERKVKSRKRGDVEVEEFTELKDERGQWFRYFDDISGYSGVSWASLIFTNQSPLEGNGVW